MLTAVILRFTAPRGPRLYILPFAAAWQSCTILSGKDHTLDILFIGDIMGRPGRAAVSRFLPDLRQELALDLVIANCENAAGGKGLTADVAAEIFRAGVDVMTGGNHSWANREGTRLLEQDHRILRPANYPDVEDIPGNGWGVYETLSGYKLAVINLQGRVFMHPLECPFLAARRLVAEIRDETPLIVVDFHAEATSEKVALGWYLENDVSAVLGTHTHVMTADERILPGGAAYITDVGMTGPHDGVIGVQRDIILQRMITQMPGRHKVASGDIRLSAVHITIDPETGKARSIERIVRRMGSETVTDHS